MRRYIGLDILAKAASPRSPRDLNRPGGDHHRYHRRESQPTSREDQIKHHFRSRGRCDEPVREDAHGLGQKSLVRQVKKRL
jgi:hypothetical protein